MISKIGTNKYVQRFINKTSNEKFYNKLDHNLPLIESLATTFCYVGVTQLDRRIDKDRKPAMIWQSLIGGLAGILASHKLDNFAKKHSEKLCIELEKLNLEKPRNTIKGVRVLIPVLITTVVMRYGVSVLSVPLATLITKFKKKDA